MKKVLSTKTLGPSLITDARSLGLDIHGVDFIKAQATGFKIEPRKKYDALIFTSANAVKYFFDNTEAAEFIKAKKVFSTGHKTADELSAHGIEIDTTANNASELAAQIIQDHSVKSVLHICGTQALDILKIKLEGNDISYKQLVVYKTIMLKPKLPQQHFDAIMFFSPSGVESFYAKNKAGAKTLCCCIGHTTADALKKIDGSANIVIAGAPAVEEMIYAISKYFMKLV